MFHFRSQNLILICVAVFFSQNLKAIDVAGPSTGVPFYSPGCAAGTTLPISPEVGNPLPPSASTSSPAMQQAIANANAAASKVICPEQPIVAEPMLATASDGGAQTMCQKPKNPPPPPQCPSEAQILAEAQQAINDAMQVLMLSMAFQQAIQQCQDSGSITIGGGFSGNWCGTTSRCSDIANNMLPVFDQIWLQLRQKYPNCAFNNTQPVTVTYSGPGGFEFYPFQHIYFGIVQNGKLIYIIDPWAFGDGACHEPDEGVCWTFGGVLGPVLNPINPLPIPKAQ